MSKFSKHFTELPRLVLRWSSATFFISPSRPCLAALLCEALWASAASASKASFRRFFGSALLLVCVSPQLGSALQGGGRAGCTFLVGPRGSAPGLLLLRLTGRRGGLDSRELVAALLSDFRFLRVAVLNIRAACAHSLVPAIGFLRELASSNFRFQALTSLPEPRSCSEGLSKTPARCWGHLGSPAGSDAEPCQTHTVQRTGPDQKPAGHLA